MYRCWGCKTPFLRSPSMSHIVFLENIRDLHYVRVQTFTFPTRSRPVNQKFMNLEGPGRIVGYEVLESDIPYDRNKLFHRKVYLVLKEDWCNDKNGIYSSTTPIEAVYVSDILGHVNETYNRVVHLEKYMRLIASVPCRTTYYCSLHKNNPCVTCLARKALKNNTRFKGSNK